MNRRLTRLDITRVLQAVTEGDPRVLALYLFGSWGRGEETDDSDVDIGILFGPAQTLQEMRRAGDLAPFERERRRLLLQP